MAIYRPQRRRWVLAAIAAAAGLLVGLLLGYALRGDPDPLDAIEETRTTLLSAAATLEIVGVEYAEAVEGEEIVAPPEYEAALAALASSRERYREVAGVVEVLNPAAVTAAEDGYRELERMIRDRENEGLVRAATEDLGDTLAAAIRR